MSEGFDIVVVLEETLDLNKLTLDELDNLSELVDEEYIKRAEEEEDCECPTCMNQRKLGLVPDSILLRKFIETKGAKEWDDLFQSRLPKLPCDCAQKISEMDELAFFFAILSGQHMAPGHDVHFAYRKAQLAISKNIQ